MHDLASLYAVNAGDVDVFDTLLDRIKTMNTDMVAATVALFGHVLERSRVECAVAAIADRAWDANVSIASSLATGLTSRMKMFGMGSVGALEPIPPHPGRMVLIVCSRNGWHSTTMSHVTASASRLTQ